MQRRNHLFKDKRYTLSKEGKEEAFLAPATHGGAVGYIQTPGRRALEGEPAQ
jgi:hypothetical protein